MGSDFFIRNYRKGLSNILARIKTQKCQTNILRAIYGISLQELELNQQTNNYKMEKPQQQPLRINSQLTGKIREALQKQPFIDQQKLIDLLQNDHSLRMKKQSIKLGVKEFFKKNKRPQPLSQDASNPPQHIKNGAIDLTSTVNGEAHSLKKKVKKEINFQFQDSPKYQFDNFGGLSQIKQQIENSILQVITHRPIYKQITTSSPNKGFLISGAVGTGKTLISYCILSHLKKMKVLCYFVSAFQLTTADGDQKIKKLFDLLQERPFNTTSVICIDNIDQLCSKQNSKKPQGSNLSTFCAYMDKYTQKQVYFIGTSSNPEKLDLLTKPGRFYKPIKIPNPTQEQRVQILSKILANHKNNLTSQQICNQIVKMTSGFVAVDIVSFIQEATNKCVERVVKSKSSQNQQQILKQPIIQFIDFKAAIKEVQPVLKRQGFAKIPTTKLSDIGALQNLKQALINQIILPMKAKQKFKKINFQVNGGGVLLYGPPGCGKTMLAKGIANQANVNFITVKGPQLLTKYVGESQEAVRKVFQRARMSAPCVIFFDQFDAIAPKRQDQGNQVTQRVVNTLLNELNGVDDRRMVFVIAATNRPDIIDQAVLRSGRIQLKLQVPMPNSKDREQILQKITQKIGKSQQLNIKGIAQRSERFSGADLNYLVKKAIISAISNDRQGIKNSDLEEALTNFKKDKLSRKQSLVLNEEDIKDQEYEYHPEQQIHKAEKKKTYLVENPSLNNDYQQNIKRNSDGILNQFIKFMAHSFKNSKNGKKNEQSPQN